MYVNQPTNQPSSKVTAAGLGGAISILAVFIAGAAGLTIPPEVASAVTILAACAAGYFQKEKVL